MHRLDMGSVTDPAADPPGPRELWKGQGPFCTSPRAQNPRCADDCTPEFHSRLCPLQLRRDWDSFLGVVRKHGGLCGVAGVGGKVSVASVGDTLQTSLSGLLGAPCGQPQLLSSSNHSGTMKHSGWEPPHSHHTQSSWLKATLRSIEWVFKFPK